MGAFGSGSFGSGYFGEPNNPVIEEISGDNRYGGNAGYGLLRYKGELTSQPKIIPKFIIQQFSDTLINTAGNFSNYNYPVRVAQTSPQVTMKSIIQQFSEPYINGN